MFKKYAIFLLMTIFMILLGCGKVKKDQTEYEDLSKPLSWGKSGTIFVFADKKAWDYSKLEIKNSLERVFFTTTNEKLFTIEKENVADVNKFYKFANLLFLCDISSNKETSTYVKSILPERLLSISDSIKGKMIASKDQWVRGQTVVFILGSDLKNLLLYTFENINSLFEVFYNRELKRLSKIVYRPGINESEIEYEKNHYPWHLKLPSQYFVFKRDNKNNFVSYLLRVEKHPDRFLAVYWENMPEKNLNKEWLWNLRTRIGKEYYSGDLFYPEDVRQEKIEFLSYKGYKLSGRWQNPQNYTGGAFTSFAFYDKKQKIGYMIDNSVYFPKGKKLRALLELEIISKTFKTNK